MEAQDHRGWDGGEHQLLAHSLGARAFRRSAIVGPDRRDMNHACAKGGRRHRRRLGAKGLHRVEPLPTALEQDADQIDHHVGIACSGFDHEAG